MYFSALNAFRVSMRNPRLARYMFRLIVVRAAWCEILIRCDLKDRLQVVYSTVTCGWI